MEKLQKWPHVSQQCTILPHSSGSNSGPSHHESWHTWITGTHTITGRGAFFIFPVHYLIFLVVTIPECIRLDTDCWFHPCPECAFPAWRITTCLWWFSPSRTFGKHGSVHLFSVDYEYLGEAGFPGGSAVKNPPANAGAAGEWVRSLGREDALEKGMAAHSSVLVRRIPWTEETGKLQSTGSQKVWHDWSELARTHQWEVIFILHLGLDWILWLKSLAQNEVYASCIALFFQTEPPPWPALLPAAW